MANVWRLLPYRRRLSLHGGEVAAVLLSILGEEVRRGIEVREGVGVGGLDNCNRLVVAIAAIATTATSAIGRLLPFIRARPLPASFPSNAPVDSARTGSEEPPEPHARPCRDTSLLSRGPAD
jgi:hypothetical protein